MTQRTRRCVEFRGGACCRCHAESSRRLAANHLHCATALRAVVISKAFLVTMRIEFHLAAKNPIDNDGVTDYTGNANCGNDQHR